MILSEDLKTNGFRMVVTDFKVDGVSSDQY